jgi:hemerythrin-like domain-containing protein
MKATQYLKKEHEEIAMMLSIMQKITHKVGGGEKLYVEHYEKIIDFLEGFADKCHHHAKEELILFPAMESKGIKKDEKCIGLELKEHKESNDFVQSLHKAFNVYKKDSNKGAIGVFAGLLNYINLLRSHIEKENNVLFKMADEVLSDKEQEVMLKAFIKQENKITGEHKLAEFRKNLYELKAIYL